MNHLIHTLQSYPVIGYLSGLLASVFPDLLSALMPVLDIVQHATPGVDVATQYMQLAGAFMGVLVALLTAIAKIIEMWAKRKKE